VVKADRLKRERLRHFEARQVLNKEQRERKKKDQFLWTGAAVLAIVLSSFGLVAYDTIGPGAPATVPDASLSEYRQWTGEMTLEDVELSLSLQGELAPQAVANFVHLSKNGFYLDTACHRLTTAGIFVLQCGDPLGTGNGNPGYTFGPVENAPEDNFYPAGTIAMARSSNGADTQGSQFFIVYQDSTIPSDLAGGYTVLGAVTSPLDEFIDRFVTPGVEGGATDGRPLALAQIRSITIR
jgi:peptidyl-prolyl cis-trans isomerase B (cyclophilin B)